MSTKNGKPTGADLGSIRTVIEEIDLDDAEKMRLANENAEIEQEIDSLKDARRETNREIRDLEKKRKQNSTEIRTGRGEREVEVRLTVGGGTTRGFHPDTGDVVFERASTPEELQMEFGEVN